MKLIRSWLWVFRGVGVVALVAMSAGLFVKWQADAAQQDFDETMSRLTPLVQVAPVPIPKGLPLRGEEGLDADGYPRQWVDKPGLRSLLIHHRFAELDTAFTHFEDAFEKNPRFEYWPLDAADAFSTSEPALRPHFDAWVKASPQSFAAALCRGVYLMRVAYSQRGVVWAKNTSEREFDEMRATLPLVPPELDRALTLRPGALAGLREKLRWAQLADAHGVAAAIRAVDVGCPSCFQPRVTALKALRPRWGGSLAGMRAYAKSAPVADNPRLALLEGYVPLDDGELAFANKEYVDAQADIDRACAAGEHWEFLLWRGRAEMARGKLDDALADFERAEALRPGNGEVLVARADVRLRRKEAELAGQDFLDALRIDPTDARVDWLYPQVVAGLCRASWVFQKAGKLDDALRVLDLAAEIAPLDGEVLARIKDVRSVPLDEAGLTALRAKVDASPDDVKLVRRLDSALANEKRYDEIVALWTKYLGAHPDEGRAYMERAGAWHHLGRLEETKGDLEQACERGITEGCARLRR